MAELVEGQGVQVAVGACVGWRGTAVARVVEQAKLKVYSCVMDDSVKKLDAGALLLCCKTLVYSTPILPYVDGAMVDVEEAGKTFESPISKKSALLLAVWGREGSSTTPRLLGIGRVFINEQSLSDVDLKPEGDLRLPPWSWLELETTDPSESAFIKLGLVRKHRRPTEPKPAPLPRPPVKQSSDLFVPPFAITVVGSLGATRIALWQGAGVLRRQVDSIKLPRTSMRYFVCGGAERGATLRLEAGGNVQQIRLVSNGWARQHTAGDKKGPYITVALTVVEDALCGWLRVILDSLPTSAAEGKRVVRVAPPSRTWCVVSKSRLSLFGRRDSLNAIATVPLDGAQLKLARARSDTKSEARHDVLLLKPTNSNKTLLLDKDTTTTDAQWSTWLTNLRQFDLGATEGETDIPKPLDIK